MAGYIGKSLATGGTAVDAYSKTQADGRYLGLAGGTMTGNITMTGGNTGAGIRQGILSLSATTTITTAHPNVILVTTAGTDRTMTLPAASTVGGQVYRFVKVDTGTGKLIIARAGSDTMGINANLTMELWYQDNYVDLMSDGSSRWIVMSTEMFTFPDADISTTGNPHGLSTFDTWTDAIYNTGDQIVPAGTESIRLHVDLEFTGDGTSNGLGCYGRKKGSSAGQANTVALTWTYAQDTIANGDMFMTRNDVVVQCDINRTFEVNIYRSGGGSGTANLYIWKRGYRLG